MYDPLGTILQRGCQSKDGQYRISYSFKDTRKGITQWNQAHYDDANQVRSAIRILNEYGRETGFVYTIALEKRTVTLIHFGPMGAEYEVRWISLPWVHYLRD